MSDTGEGENRGPAGDHPRPQQVRFVRVPRPGPRPAPHQAGGGVRRVRRVRRIRTVSPPRDSPAATDQPPTPPADEPARRLRVRWILLPLGVLVLAWLVACAVTTVEAVGKLHGGVDALTTARGDLHLASLQTAPVNRSLHTATGDFSSAHGLLSEPWMAPLDVAPYLGRQLASARSLASAAHTVTAAGSTALVETQALLGRPHDQPAQQAVLLVKLQAVVDPLAARLNHVNLGPSDALLPSLASRRATFAGDLSRLRSDVNRGSAALKAVSNLMAGPRTYLVFAANNAEMRAGAGDYLAVGTLSTSDGAFTVSPFTETDQLVNPASTVPVTGDMAARWGGENPSQDYRNLSFTPQFPANAALAAQMWQAQTGQAVDGVLLIDVDALRSLLSATGPVSAGGQTVTADTVDQLLLEQQYAGVSNDQANQARQDQLPLLASSILGVLQGNGTSITALAGGLADAAGGRHLVLWSADPSIEAAWVASGAGGTVGTDGVLLSMINNNANKLDPYQAIGVRMTTARAGRNTRLTFRATFTNRAPLGLSPYASQGNDPTIPAGTYRGSVTLDFPRTVLSATVSPAGSGGPDYGSEVLGVPLTLAPGQSTVVTWTLVLTGHHGSVVVEPSARVPPTAWIGPNGDRFTDDTGHTVAW